MGRRKISFRGQPSLPFDDLEDPAYPSLDQARRNIYASIEIPQPKKPLEASDRLIYYFSMGSGSSGNSCYIGTSKGGILIDAGVKAEEIETMIRSNGLTMNHIKGVLLTHDHADHVKHVYTLVRNNRHIRIFCTNRVLNGLLRRHSISRRIQDYHIPIFKEIPFKAAEFEITAFEVSHDGSDNMGFSLEFDSRRFVIATDMGLVTSRADFYIKGANYLVMESNYDLDMLLHGRYPEFLKARIQTDRGHMDNKKTAEYIAEILSPQLSHIFLCHLSQDNNSPEIAVSEVKKAIEATGKTVGNASHSIKDREADVQLMALPRYGTTRMFVFRPPLEA